MRPRLVYSFLFVLPIALQAGSITLNSSANPAVFGHPVTLTAVVLPASSTGKVTFYDGAAVLETEPLVSGKAVFTTALLASGARALKGYYLGDANNPAIASSVLTEQVNTVPGTAFKSGASYPVPYQDAYYQSIAAADFNGDGKADLIVAGQNADPGGIGTVSILIGNGDGTFQPE